MQVKSYFNADEMFADLDKLRMDAIKAFANCTEKQKALKEGDVFITTAFEVGTTSTSSSSERTAREGLIILNEILENSHSPNDEDKEEFEYAKESGYVMVKAWSNACPEGEMGSVHRSRALFKVIDSKKHTTEAILKAFTYIWRTGGDIDKYDIQWINSDGNLEVLT